jgi:hypothetical protein
VRCGSSGNLLWVYTRLLNQKWSALKRRNDFIIIGPLP